MRGAEAGAESLLEARAFAPVSCSNYSEPLVMEAAAAPLKPASVLSRARRSGWLAALGLATLFVAHALFTTQGALMDDAYIAFRYAQRLAAGHGLTFQDGAPPVEGFTCLSWVLLGALFERGGVPCAVALPLLGIVCGAVTVALATRAAQRFARPPGIAAGLVSGAFLACMPSLAYYSGSGLETGWFTLLTLLALLAGLEGRSRALALWASLALLTRPEGALVAALSLGIGSWRAPRVARRDWFQAAAIVAVVAAALGLFRWLYFREWVPNTALAKPPSWRAGVDYVAWGLIDSAALLSLTALLLLRQPGGRRRELLCLGWFALWVLAALAEGGDWMTGGRLLLPAFVGAALALGALPAALAELSRRPRWTLAALAALAGAFYLRFSWVDSTALADGSTSARLYDPVRDEVAGLMVKAGVRSVGTLDIGRVAFAAPELHLVDLGGLTDRRIARAPGDYRSKRLSPDLLGPPAPDAFLFTAHRIEPPGPHCSDFYYPVEASLAGSAWFRDHYRLRVVKPVMGQYVLCWYQRPAR